MATMLKPVFLHHLEALQIQFKKTTIQTPNSPRRRRSVIASCSDPLDASSVEAQRLVQQFNPKVPVQEALTPPSSWYTRPSFLSLELDRVFYRGWQVVGCTEQINNPRDFFTGRLGNVEFVVCRDDNGDVCAFHNVCRHHASLLASGSGQKSCFVCPYHGWTYGLDGALLKATRITGMRNFNVSDFGLVPIKVATWGAFVLLNLDKEVSLQRATEGKGVGSEWLGSCSEILSVNGVDSSLSYVCRREYNIECNWKVFCDNYLDGGYHVPYAHKDLASSLQLDSYSSTDDKAFIEGSLEDSERVQMEDIKLCEGVQLGLESPAYCSGRYAPAVEKPMHHFHCLLHHDLSQ
ncbi:choline monooxygenase, chloroplastic isoform X3 [Malania oleifera]|uniref:choline monooxygenase, chloroplastic isoform X3 n=1 Tax=Malania oleifera TaxID=397392 RepID=UPI0025AE53E8|nr:choline monooxygenase, chloroplastic isoform X3 [Malania oleifera]